MGLELDLLKEQYKYGASIFACDQWDVFADVSVPLGPAGYVTIKVEDALGEFHQVRRKGTGTWVNWATFYQVWIKIREVGKWETTDYTVKLERLTGLNRRRKIRSGILKTVLSSPRQQHIPSRSQRSTSNAWAG